MSEPIADPTGKVVLELRAIAAGWEAPFTDCKVDPGSLEPEHTPKGGKAPIAVVVKRSTVLPRRRLPIGSYLFLFDCYHPDPRLASELAGLVAGAFHNVGPRSSGVIGIFQSATVALSGSLIEPGTGWPLERVSVQVTAFAHART